ncbi:histone-lysine N-methyltransferase SETMAR [Trichonephila clavipes]|nr:histone-lysine N-methyltransferase SETMAR [Trichonephila clavipes]
MMPELAEKWPHFPKQKVLFHQGNAASHTLAIAMAKIHEISFELLNHPPYSPDKAPSDFFLFPHLKLRSEDRDFRQIKRQSTS